MYGFHAMARNSKPRERTISASVTSMHSISAVPPRRLAIAPMPTIEPPLTSSAPTDIAADELPSNRYGMASR
jgi:hypothetical protein